MRVALLTFGTRGDIQPFVAIGHALKERGHDVVFIASQDQTPFAARVGLQTCPVPVDAKAIMEGEVGQHMLRNGHLLRFAKMLQDVTNANLDAVVPVMADGLKGADLILAHVLLLPYPMVLAREDRILRVFTAPLPPTSAFATPLIGRARLGPFNRLSHRLINRLGARVARTATDAAARFANKEPPANAFDRSEEIEMPAIHLVSKALIPPPPDMPPWHAFTGDLRLSASVRALLGEGTTDPVLESFLRAGPAPVFFGFGSMPVADPRATLELVAQVARTLDVRALLGAGWSAITPGHHADGRVFVTRAFDHDSVLPRCRAAVHHGGAGTTHAALRAGLPAVVCPFLVDQPWWADMLIARGVGAKVPFRKINAARLTHALRPLLANDVKARAEALGQQMRAEDGLSVAIEHIERFAERSGAASDALVREVARH